MSRNFKYVVKKQGGKYLAVGGSSYEYTSENPRDAAIWNSYFAAISYAEENEGAVYKWCTDGREIYIGPDFEA
jgi:hypothetical protein